MSKPYRRFTERHRARCLLKPDHRTHHCSLNHPSYRTIRAGLSATTTSGGTSLVTTARAATTDRAPIETPFSTIAPGFTLASNEWLVPAEAKEEAERLPPQDVQSVKRTEQRRQRSAHRQVRGQQSPKGSLGQAPRRAFAAQWCVPAHVGCERFFSGAKGDHCERFVRGAKGDHVQLMCFARPLPHAGDRGRPGARELRSKVSRGPQA